MYFWERKNGIPDSDEKNCGMRDSREKGAGMRDQDPLPDPVFLYEVQFIHTNIQPEFIDNSAITSTHACARP